MPSENLRASLTERTPSPYDRFLTKVSLRRRPVIMRALYHLSTTMPERPMNLSGGLPDPGNFIFQDASLTLRVGGEKVVVSAEEMDIAQQYQNGAGYEPLLDFAKGLMIEYHNPPNWEDKSLVMVNGGTEGFSQSMEMLLEEGDGVIIPEYVYSATLSYLMPLAPTVLSVPCDKEGMMVDELRRMLKHHTGKKIKFLFAIPTGCNPTGVTFSPQCRKEVYQLACEYDFLIIEDDPYFFIRLDEKNQRNLSIPEFPSFMSIDTESRVLRVDSFSKVFGPGFRCGWVTGPKPLIQTMIFRLQCSSNHANMFSQVAISATLKKWGKQGFMEHVKKVQNFYRTQKEAIVLSAEKHLTGLAEWDAPTDGMFLWIKLLKVADAEELVIDELITAGVMVTPGSAFTATPEKACPYIRVAYSLKKPADFDKGFSILAQVVKSRDNKVTKK